jgi:hypothetical protein
MEEQLPSTPVPQTGLYEELAPSVVDGTKSHVNDNNR